jgi:hypothetical protein
VVWLGLLFLSIGALAATLGLFGGRILRKLRSMINRQPQALVR